MFIVLCLDRKTGKTLWRREATRKIPLKELTVITIRLPHQLLMVNASTVGLVPLDCLNDLDGKKLWERDLGKVKIGASLGEGCSPVLHKDKLVVVRDSQGQSSIQVLNAISGKTLWKKNRNTRNGWSTPLVIEHAGKTQIITTASRQRPNDSSTWQGD